MRSVVLVIAVGITIGCLGWITLGRLDRPAIPDDASAEAPIAAPAAVSIADALSMPVFAGPAPGPTFVDTTAQTPASVRLVGITYTTRRRAALLSNGGEAFWLSVGQSKEGITATRIQRQAVDIEINGVARTLLLFKAPSSSNAAPPAETPSADPRPRANEPASAPETGPTEKKAGAVPQPGGPPG